MHIQTHILSGWLAGNFVRLTPRERFFAMAAASLSDVDGLGIVVSQEAYWALHHKLGHNVFFFAVAASIASALSSHRLRVWLLCFAMGWVHFTLDYLGSGPGWALYPWWPVNERFARWTIAWPLSSWQNYATFYAMVALALWIAWRFRRTPFEWAIPAVDRVILKWIPTSFTPV